MAAKKKATPRKREIKRPTATNAELMHVLLRVMGKTDVLSYKYREAKDQVVDFDAARMQAYKGFTDSVSNVNLVADGNGWSDIPWRSKHKIAQIQELRDSIDYVSDLKSDLDSRLAQIDAMDPQKKK